MLTIIIGVSICIFLVLFAFFLGVKLTRKQAQEELERVVNDARINEDLDDFERTKIKEWRMIKAGARFCIQCTRVSGLYYQSADKNEKPKGITLKRIGVTQKKQDIFKCTDCIQKGEKK